MEDPTDSGAPVKSNLVVGQAWLDAGFGGELIVLHIGDKKPFGDQWQKKDWQPQGLLRRLADGHNLGIKTRHFVAFDIEDTPQAGYILAALRVRFGHDVPVRSRPGSNSHAILVRLDDPLDLSWHKTTIVRDDGVKLLEMLGEGQQLHVAGQRADKGGVELTWSAQPTVQNLPAVGTHELVDVVMELRAGLESAGIALKDGKTPGSASTGTGGEECSQAEAKRLLSIIPNGDAFVTRDAWVQMGHALYGASGGDQWGKDLWLDWSDQQPQKDGEAERVWDTMVDVRSGAGFLRQKAQELAPYEFAKQDFDDITDLEAGRNNPETKGARFLAAEVLRTARMEDSSAREVYEPAEDFAAFKARVKTLVKPKPIIPGFAYDGIVHGIIAGPGVGKSLLALHACTSAVHGVLPRDGADFDPGHYAQAIMLFAEDGEDIVGDRALAVATHHATAGQEVPGLVFKTFCNKPLELLQIDEKSKRILPVVTRGLHQLCDSLELILLREQDIGGQAPVVLVFDMMRNASFADENQRPNVDALFRLWKAVMAVFKAHGGPPIGIVFTHHKTKAATRGDQTGTTSAGSIGIEGNARRITELKMVAAGALLEARLTKVNDGITGEATYWRKETVPSQVQGGTETALLVPVSAQDANAILTGEVETSSQDLFQMESQVTALHRWASLRTAPPISHGRKIAPRGFITVPEALARIPECSVLDAKDAHALEQLAVELGAFTRGGRRKVDGTDCRSVFEPVSNWAPAVAPVPDNGPVAQNDECPL